MEKANVYIDGANIFYTQKKLGWSVDWKKLTKYLKKRWEIDEVRYYTGVKIGDKKMQRYLRYFHHLGIFTVTKPLKKIKTEKGFIFKSNFDVEMATDILLDTKGYNEIILFSGDSDFEYVAKKLKENGKKLLVFSSRKTLSWELKLAANEYFFLEDIQEFIGRK